jgi:elongation factor P
MGILAYNEVLLRTYIVLDGAPYECIDAHIFRMQQRKPVNQTKLRNHMTGKVVEHSFHQSDKVETAEIEKNEVKFLYTNKGEYWFCDVKDPSKRFKLSAEMVGEGIRFIKNNSIINTLLFNEEIIGVELPIKVDLKVTEAFPAVKGDTARGGTKEVTLETGATVQVPMFIGEGEIIRINTSSGEYTERVNK